MPRKQPEIDVPPQRPPAAAPQPKSAMSEVAACMVSLASEASRSCRCADRMPQGTVLGGVCSRSSSRVGDTHSVCRNEEKVMVGRVTWIPRSTSPQRAWTTQDTRQG